MLNGFYERLRMIDPVMTTLTASAIATIAFQKLIKSSSLTLDLKFTGETITKMGKLREKITIEPI